MIEVRDLTYHQASEFHRAPPLRLFHERVYFLVRLLLQGGVYNAVVTGSPDNFDDFSVSHSHFKY